MHYEVTARFANYVQGLQSYMCHADFFVWLSGEMKSFTNYSVGCKAIQAKLVSSFYMHGDIECDSLELSAASSCSLIYN